jgi:hypothetical protein
MKFLIVRKKTNNIYSKKYLNKFYHFQIILFKITIL